ncbi:MAG: aldehyde dehydrogenase family protein, partial [Planctomycetota bacterium]
MLTVIDPSTGSTIREVPLDEDAVIEEKLARAASTYADWRRASFAERAAVLRSVAAQLRADVEELAPLMTEEMGKPIKEARGEVQKAAWCAEHYAEHAGSYLASQEIASDATRSWVQYLPLGTVLGVLPWNAP